MERVRAIDEVTDCIKDNKNFVLQGGAGSGKTEMLKQALEFISDCYPSRKVICITHTNLAVEQIKLRVNERFTVSTIHSFLNDFIRDYKKNIHQVIYKLFLVDPIVRQGIGDYDGDEKVQNKKEHGKYKKVYEKYSAFLFTMKEERADKVEGKKEYDTDPEGFNDILNDKIDLLNAEILKQVRGKDYNQIK